MSEIQDAAQIIKVSFEGAEIILKMEIQAGSL